jgi:hypothetical protein
MLLCSSNHVGCDAGPFVDSQMHDGYSRISGKARADYSSFANWVWHLCFCSLFSACSLPLSISSLPVSVYA